MAAYELAPRGFSSIPGLASALGSQASEAHAIMQGMPRLQCCHSHSSTSHCKQCQRGKARPPHSSQCCREGITVTPSTQQGAAVAPPARVFVNVL